MALSGAPGIKPRKFSHYAFDAGENKGEPPTFFSKSELDRTLNVENRSDGLTTRYGSSVFNVNGSGYPSPIGGNPRINSIAGFQYGAASYETLFTASDKIYRNLASPVQLKTGLTANLNFQTAKAADIFYLTNGTDAVQYFDPGRSLAQTYTAGYDTPGAFTATPGGGGNMANGTYEYYVTLFDENTETESNRQAAAVSAVVVAGPNGSVNLTNLPTDPESRSSHHIIYRKDPSGFYFFRIAKIAYVAAGSHLDTVASTGTQFQAPNDNDRPDPSDCICLHGKVMVYAKDNILTWSKNYRYQNVPTYNRERLDDNSQNIVRLVSFKETLVIWKTDSIYVVKGDLNSDNYEIKKISGFVGTRAPFTVCESPQGIFFLDSRKKPRLITPTDFDSEDLREETDISYKFRKKFDAIPLGKLQYCHAVFWDVGAVSQYRVFVPIETTGNYPNYCFVYDYLLALRNRGDSAWFTFRYNVNMVSSAVATASGGVTQLQIGDDYGLLWKFEDQNQFYDGDEFLRAEGSGTVTYGANTITVSNATMAVNQYVGMQIVLYAKNTFREIFRARITANTATVFTVDIPVPALETTDPCIVVGGYLTYFATANYTHDRASQNRPFKMSLLFNLELDSGEVYFFTHYDFNEEFNFNYEYINNPSNPSLTPLADTYLLDLSNLNAVYDEAIYDTSRYGVARYDTIEFPLNSKYLFNHVSWGLVTREPARPFGYIGGTYFYQPKGLTR